MTLNSAIAPPIYIQHFNERAKPKVYHEINLGELKINQILMKLFNV